MQHPHQCFKAISSFNLLSITRMVPNCTPQARPRPETDCMVSCVSTALSPFDICWKGRVAGWLCALAGFFGMQCNTETAAAEDSGNSAAAD